MHSGIRFAWKLTRYANTGYILSISSLVTMRVVRSIVINERALNLIRSYTVRYKRDEWYNDGGRERERKREREGKRGRERRKRFDRNESLGSYDFFTFRSVSRTIAKCLRSFWSRWSFRFSIVLRNRWARRCFSWRGRSRRNNGDRSRGQWPDENLGYIRKRNRWERAPIAPTRTK